MAVAWYRRSAGAEAADLSALEAMVGAELPTDYRAFLTEQDGGEPASNAFAIPNADNESGVNEFLSVRQAMDELRRYGDRLPPHTVPIALAEGGNLILLALDNGGVTFWDHELEGADPSFALEDSFSAFWQALESFDASSVELKPGQVKSAWVDPDLLK
jgi:hypothetical protein